MKSEWEPREAWADARLRVAKGQRDGSRAVRELDGWKAVVP